MEYILAAILIAVLVLQEIRQRRTSKRNITLSIENSKTTDILRDLQTEVVNLQDELGGEREKNRALLSQKKSSETRLGQISEHLIPFLDNCPYNPKDLHFLGNPIDYLVFDFDEGKITFLEVKSGNSKPSKRQKIIKNMIKCGRVFYDEIRVNEKGIKIKKIQNNYEGTPIEENNEGNTNEQD
jgi:predicted Holliday junction resolvase-like endonuclease